MFSNANRKVFDANHTHRHNAGLSALYTAVLAASSTTVSLGDKGDA